MPHLSKKKIIDPKYSLSEGNWLEKSHLKKILMTPNYLFEFRLNLKSNITFLIAGTHQPDWLG